MTDIEDKIITDTINRLIESSSDDAKTRVVPDNHIESSKTIQTTSRSQPDIDSHCMECNKEFLQKQTTLSCYDCGSKTHASCTQIKSSLVNKVLEFYCRNCILENKRILFRCRKASPKEVDDKMKNNYDVEEIQDYKWSTLNKRKTRFFEIKWLGYKKTTWEPEKNLADCLDMLQEFCMDNNLELSTIEGRWGADKKDNNINQANWINKPQLFATYEQARKKRGLPHIKIEMLNKFEHENTIFFYPYNQHLYVLYYIAKEKKCYVADGRNFFLNDKNKRNKILEYINAKSINFEGIYYGQQTRVDFCGSSAILIAIAFNAFNAKHTIPTSLVVSKKLRTFVIKKLHHYESKLVANHRKTNYAIMKLTCNQCNKKFKKGRQLNAHAITCGKI